MEKYIHKVQYYETDKMGITHHSNYIRWMEEARVDFLDRIGFGYAKLEEDGIMSPVIGIECDYKNSTTFDDVIEIEVGIEEFKGVKLIIKYTMKNQRKNDVVLTGKSIHCFVNLNNKPIILKKAYPEFDKKLKDLADK
ncbi:MAG: acyl-CoA thioesterase [Clostridiales bacterium]|nr:acyl-CoA thioesterase [Clostridiales bacterium]